MSCYFRHMKDLLVEAGVEVTPENKKEVDRIIHQIVGVAYKDCPSTWRRLKEMMAQPGGREKLLKKLKI